MDYTSKTNDDSNENNDSNNNKDYVPTPFQVMVERIVTNGKGFDSRTDMVPLKAKDSLIGVQIALANMDIYDRKSNDPDIGEIALSDSDIGEITIKLSGLVQQLNKSGIQYSAITSIDGFNTIYDNATYAFKPKSNKGYDDAIGDVKRLMDAVYKPKRSPIQDNLGPKNGLGNDLISKLNKPIMPNEPTWDKLTHKYCDNFFKNNKYKPSTEEEKKLIRKFLKDGGFIDLFGPKNKDKKPNPDKPDNKPDSDKK